jgi:hypothetical protein
MELAFTGKLRVRPFIFFCRRRRRSDRDHNRFAAPIRRRRLNAPDVPWLLKRNSDQPELRPRSQRNAVRNPRGDYLSRRQIIQLHRQSWFQGTRKTHSTSQRIHDQGVAVFRKLKSRIKAGDAQWKLRTDARAMARRFVRCRSQLHVVLQKFYVEMGRDGVEKGRDSTLK